MGGHPDQQYFQELTGHDSYLVISKFLSTEETGDLFNRARQLLDKFNIDDHPLVRISLRCFIPRNSAFIDEIHDG